MDFLIKDILFNYSYITLYWLTFGYFIFLYFGVGSLFLFICKTLEKKHFLNKIESKEVSKKQIAFEIKHSIKSIVVFGFSIMPIIYLIRINVVELVPNTWFNIAAGVTLLTLWNEVHFYIVHRIMHQKFMMKNVHYIHHKSRVSTVYSVFSFHWIEALLLSTIPLTIVPFIPFSIVAVFIYPLVSILLNFAGHCNYRFGEGKGTSWRLFGTYHNEHHSRGRKNYGFSLNFLDKLFSKHNK
ncbi:sterol desaturase family protein [Cellulophaga sp. 20_2_10]|uniref:sterol desaturase family protein n=1 Tax=Cellulophaga sp. 20_2_10 TaxID=2942476 RepID=UPI00201ACF17|nr:sterol desaturase family protein [Cellulophaga sp. 20_2_10]MCL5245643.1 sterol desaturase family protein [Cellulophaga sp. 20_2_10]